MVWKEFIYPHYLRSVWMINERAYFFSRDVPSWQTEKVSCQPLSYYIFKTRIYHSICSLTHWQLKHTFTQIYAGNSLYVYPTALLWSIYGVGLLSHRKTSPMSKWYFLLVVCTLLYHVWCWFWKLSHVFAYCNE